MRSLLRTLRLSVGLRSASIRTVGFVLGRWARQPLFAATLALAGCVVPTDSASGAGEGDASTTCDGKNDCAQCSSCASQVACAAQLSACQNDSACVAIDQCVAICGADLACKQGCIDNNPAGATNYDAATRCLYCTECPKDCAGYRVCG